MTATGNQNHSHLVCKQTPNHFKSVWLNGWVFVYKLTGCGSNPIADIAPASSNEFLDIQATTKCRFTLKRECDLIKRQS